MLFPTSFLSSIVVAAAMAKAIVLPRQAAPGDYTLVFTNQTGAVQGTDFLTFGLVATTAECTAFCDSVPTCLFANSYHDNNGKGGSPLLTCSLYTGCHDEADLTNTGGQPQPDGSVNFITDSDGWCKAAEEPTPTTEPTDPTTEPTTTPADPTTEPTTEPTTTPADPTTTEPAEPTTEPTEPTTPPTEPTTPTETTEPTEPTAPPAEPTTPPTEA